MTMIRSLVVATALACLSTNAFAQDASRDPRLRVLPYSPDQVIALQGHLNYQMMIEFAPNERIENVSIGDSLGWQVTPNQAATLLFLKPIQAHAATNMTVVTNRRRYAFALRAAAEARGPDDPRLVYSVRFSYPAEEAAQAADVAPPAFNFDYAVSGARAIAPIRVFDDGHATYFQLPADAETPAIFALGADGSEEVVNSQVRGAYIVVDQLAAAFVLRHGNERATVQSGAAAAPAAEATPRRRPRRGRA
jgi:type IV secretion system protein VirB9